jgi:hypothetical protein
MDLTASPVCFMHPANNSISFAFSTNNTPTGLQRNDFAFQSVANMRDQNYMAVIEIDYCPMSRWAHIAVVVKDMYMILYLDGDIIKKDTVMNAVSPTGVRSVINPATGTIFVGGEASVIGQIAKMECANYAATNDDVRRMYSMGPSMQNFGTRMLGLPQYGVRSPIYRITS